MSIKNKVINVAINQSGFLSVCNIAENTKDSRLDTCDLKIELVNSSGTKAEIVVNYHARVNTLHFVGDCNTLDAKFLNQIAEITTECRKISKSIGYVY